MIHPQNETERLLKNAFSELSPYPIRYGFEVTDFRDNGDHLVVYSHDVSQSPDKHVSQSREDRCPILIGCDGKNSTLRRMAGIAFVGGPYPDTYIMGDFQT